MANPYQQMAVAAAKMYGLDPGIFSRQIAAESGWNPNAVSSAGAQGIAQFMPATAKGMGVNPLDPKSALYGAAKMDAGNLQKYGSYEQMLSAYNSGKANAYKNPNFAKGETARYVAKIMGGKTGSYVASGGTTPAPDERRNALLSYLMQSNNALSNHQQAPSIAPYLAAIQQNVDNNFTGGAVGGKLPTNTVTSVTSKFLGVPYKWGGNDPKSGIDCSAFMQQAYAQMGIKLPRTTYDQAKLGSSVSLKNLQPGDAVFTEPGKAGPNHVGMYIGNGMIQESPHTGDVNKTLPLKSFLTGGFVTARRYTH